MAKGHPMAPGATRPFQKGSDPRRNLGGRPKTAHAINEIRNEVRDHLLISLREVYTTDVEKVKEMLKDDKRPMGEMIALKFLYSIIETADPARITLLAKIVGINMAPDIQINTQINMSMRDLVLAANEGEKENAIVEEKINETE